MKPLTLLSTAAGQSAPLMLDVYGWPTVSLQVVVTGGATYTIQQTLDTPGPSATWFDHPDALLVGATTNKQGNYGFLPTAIRINQTGAGTVRLTAIQPGASPA